MKIVDVVARMREDLGVVLERDPSVHSTAEALLAPHLLALWLHRVAHRLHGAGHRIAARLVFLLGRHLSGIEIHPGARIGRRLFIDHGLGTVIGETVRIGDDVTLYHQVTLGAVGWWKDRTRPPGRPRHPQLGNGVVIGAHTLVLGPVEIGDHARIGAQSLVLDDVPPGGVVSGAPSPVPARNANRNGRSPATRPIGGESR